MILQRNHHQQQQKQQPSEQHRENALYLIHLRIGVEDNGAVQQIRMQKEIKLRWKAGIVKNIRLLDVLMSDVLTMISTQSLLLSKGRDYI